MKYIKSLDEKPHDGVDVYVVTDTGKKGVAKFWSSTQQWLTSDRNLKPDDIVVKWKYAQAKLTHAGEI